MVDSLRDKIIISQESSQYGVAFSVCRASEPNVLLVYAASDRPKGNPQIFPIFTAALRVANKENLAEYVQREFRGFLNDHKTSFPDARAEAYKLARNMAKQMGNNPEIEDNTALFFRKDFHI